MKKLVWIVMIAAGGFFLWQHYHHVPRAPVTVLAQEVAGTYGKVERTRAEGGGAPIVVFEEDHASVSGQVEEALMLTRLYERYQLRETVLEGYNGHDLESSAGKVRDVIGLHSGATVERIAATLLREGEINAAEFLSLVYPDVHIDKGESGGGARSGENQAEIELLLKSRLLFAFIAIQHNALSHQESATFLQELKPILPIDSTEKANRLVKICDPVIQKDPWTQAHNDALFPQDPSHTVSIEQELAAIGEIKTEAAKLSGELASLASITDEFERFLQGRARASEELAQAALTQSGRHDVPVVAMIIGAAHTARVTKLLDDAGATYAVVSPASLGSETDMRLAGSTYDRKASLQSVSTDLSGALDSAFPSVDRRNKLPTVLQQEWLAAKAELYSATDDIVQALGSGGDGSGGRPPFNTRLAGIPDDRFNGKFIFIDRSKVRQARESGRMVYIFPVVLNPNDTTHRRTVWIKAAYSPVAVPPPGQTSKAEAALRDAFEELHEPAMAAAGGGHGGDNTPPDNDPAGDTSEPPESGAEKVDSNETGSEGKEGGGAELAATFHDIDPGQIRVSRKVTILVGDSDAAVSHRQMTL